ncbi:ParB/RepB/Spo0J family partition protein [Larsenimonas suaedae]|uniref:Probable chromosome-partitioning protein ParB n=1 Tax=Larsenimonas suaedae TaxID=1851019 RepID=A0ABU1GSC3_9GAMM|nr:ParB/RepB/Spo0J family partition protein [Larsenimonas suaedae]MCM2972721.1 ParB/RepB/Spo0J family partition protein [Larsenimonas suaedae]MDR5894482.1 ParB/RepB/Spo0J family partition protein [Larsenimonas suaedae]
MTRKRGLGRGLDALIGSGAKQRSQMQAPLEHDASTSLLTSVEENVSDTGDQGDTLTSIPVNQLRRGKYQPRRDIQPERLEELADSIRAQGVMQPIVVRPVTDRGAVNYEIIAGERRWRAAQLAELNVIPAIVRSMDDETALAMALIENIQRENLNVIEEAVALKRLIDEFELTQQQAAHAVGRSRAQIANLLRLLALDDEVQTLLERGDLDMGHARALLALKGLKQRHAARDVVARGLTVRQTEELVKRIQADSKPQATQEAPGSSDVKKLEGQLGDLLGAAVQINHGKTGKGRLTIRYSSLDELDGILSHIK